MPDLAAAVAQLGTELAADDLNVMLPGARTTPAGVALAWRERLSLSFPTITAVTVWMDDQRATLRG